MKILVWKSYGDIKVYCAESDNQLMKIADDVMSIIQGWGISVNFDLVNQAKLMQSVVKKCTVLRSTIKDLIDEHGEGADDFESFYFDTVTYQ